MTAEDNRREGKTKTVRHQLVRAASREHPAAHDVMSDRARRPINKTVGLKNARTHHNKHVKTELNNELGEMNG